MFTKKRSIQICKQIHIKEIFVKYHDGKLFTHDKKVTKYKQALAIALSISTKQCNKLKKIDKKILYQLEPEYILKILKTKELQKLIKSDKRINIDPKLQHSFESNKSYKEFLYKKYLNKKKLFNKLLTNIYI